MSNSTLIHRDRPHAERHEAVLEAFESAELSGAVTVINDQGPIPLLHQLAAKFQKFAAESTSITQSKADRFEARREKQSDASCAREEDFEATILDALRGRPGNPSPQNAGTVSPPTRHGGMSNGDDLVGAFPGEDCRFVVLVASNTDRAVDLNSGYVQRTTPLTP